MQRLKPFPGLEPGHAPIYLPAVPATDVPLRLTVPELSLITCQHAQSPLLLSLPSSACVTYSEDSSGDASSLPDQLQNPLLKTEDGTVRAIVRHVCSSLCQLLVDISVANFTKSCE